MKTVKTTPIHQQGSTLIEILVSMFILALGLMALIAMQTRTSIGIKEAENQTIIAQATENLAENMLTNPKLDVNAQLETTKSYAHYDTKDYKCNGSEKVTSLSSTTFTNPPGTDTGRTALANHHMELFHVMVCSINGVEEVNAKVDNNDKLVGGVATAGNVLHVSWEMSGSSDKKFTYDYPLDDN